MTLGEACTLSRDKLSIHLPQTEAQKTPSWIAPHLVDLVSKTFFSTQTDTITELVNAAFVEQNKELNKSLAGMGLDLGRWNAGLQERVTASCLTSCAELDKATATEVLIGLGEEKSRELEALCRSDIGKALRNVFASHSSEMQQIRSKFVTLMTIDGATKVQSYAHEFIEKERKKAEQRIQNPTT